YFFFHSIWFSYGDPNYCAFLTPYQFYGILHIITYHIYRLSVHTLSYFYNNISGIQLAGFCCRTACIQIHDLNQPVAILQLGSNTVKSTAQFFIKITLIRRREKLRMRIHSSSNIVNKQVELIFFCKLRLVPFEPSIDGYASFFTGLLLQLSLSFSRLAFIFLQPPNAF